MSTHAHLRVLNGGRAAAPAAGTRTTGTTSAGVTSAGATSAGTTRTGARTAGTMSSGTTSAGATSAGTTSAGTTGIGRTTTPGRGRGGTGGAGRPVLRLLTGGSQAPSGSGERPAAGRGAAAAALQPPRRAGRRPTAADDGYVTAEAALVLPVLLVVLAMAVWVLAAVGAQLRCTDAAGVAARAAARGDSPAAVVGAGQRAAPPGAVVAVSTGTDLVTVRVQAEVRPFGGVLSVLPALRVSGRAVAAREDAGGVP